MPLRTVCSKCESKINAPDKFAGKRAKCPKCGNVVSFPSTEPAPEPPAFPIKARSHAITKRRMPPGSIPAVVGIIAVVLIATVFFASRATSPSYSAALTMLQMERAELDRLKSRLASIEDKLELAKQRAMASAESAIISATFGDGITLPGEETQEQKEKQIKRAKLGEERVENIKRQLKETVVELSLELDSLGKTIRLQYVKVADAERAKDAAYAREHPK